MEIKYVEVSESSWLSAEDFMYHDCPYEVSSPTFRVTFDGDFCKDDKSRYALICDYNCGTKEWEVFFMDNKEGEELELAKRELEIYDKMTFAEWSKGFNNIKDYMDVIVALLKDFYGYGDEDAYKDIENEYNSMLKELNDKLYAKYKNKLNQI